MWILLVVHAAPDGIVEIAVRLGLDRRRTEIGNICLLPKGGFPFAILAVATDTFRIKRIGTGLR